jgi:predicted ATP-dependent endonuclease of OLD family
MQNTYWLSSVKMGGYKSIKSVEIDFQPGLNIIIGKNGTGKTNFLDFLDNSLKMKFQGVRDFVFDANISLENQPIKIHVKGEGVKKTVQADSFFSKGNNIKSRVKAEIELNDESKEFSRLIMENSEDVYLGEIQDYLQEKKINISSVYKIDYALPKNVLYFNKPDTINIKEKEDIAYSENGFIDILVKFSRQYFKNGKYDISLMRNEFVHQIDSLNNSPNIKTFKNYLQTYTSIKDLRLNQGVFLLEKEDTVEFANLIHEFRINDDWYFFEDLSDGTKRIVLIIFYILFIDANVFLLEEPELGIHPHQLDLLMKFLKEQSEEKQIILTTHAPQCLDILTPEELNRIIICDIADKSTQLFHLSEQKMKKAQSYMEDSDTLSNYWRFSDLENR